MSRLVANRAFRYASRDLVAGEEFEAEGKDIVVLTNLRDPLARAVSSPSEESDEEEFKKPKRYNRRDMRAKE